MRLTGAFLAENANEVNGALNVEGGVCPTLTEDSGQFHVCLVLLVQGQPENPDKTVKIEIAPLSSSVAGAPTTEMTETIPDTSLTTNAGGYAVVDLTFDRADLPTAGTYTVTVTGPDHSIMIPFNVGIAPG